MKKIPNGHLIDEIIANEEAFHALGCQLPSATKDSVRDRLEWLMYAWMMASVAERKASFRTTTFSAAIHASVMSSR